MIRGNNGGKSKNVKCHLNNAGMGNRREAEFELKRASSETRSFHLSYVAKSSASGQSNCHACATWTNTCPVSQKHMQHIKNTLQWIKHGFLENISSCSSCTVPCQEHLFSEIKIKHIIL